MSQRYVSMLLITVFALGTLVLVLLVVAAFIACLYILNLALNVSFELLSSLRALYTGGDSFVKLVLWLVLLYGLWKLLPWLVKRFCRAFHLI